MTMSRFIISATRGFINHSNYNSRSRIVSSSLSRQNYSSASVLYRLLDNNKTSTSSTSPGFSSRNLYTEATLGIEKLERIQEKKTQLFVGGSRDRYLERISNFLNNGDTRSVFKDDLINLIGVAETDEHLDLLEKFITSDHEDKELLFSGWGVTVMRLYYKLGKIDRAYNNIKDPKFSEFFSQRLSFKIVMTMLFKAGRYQDVIELYHVANERLTQRDETHGNEKLLLPIVFASYAKMNTKEALEEAEQLFTKTSQTAPERGASKTAQFLAYLAVNNDKPKFALNLISDIPNKNYIVLREMKIASLIKLERYDDILFQLREYLELIRRDTNVLLQSTYDLIQGALEKIGDASVRQELTDILVEIKDGGHVSDTTLEDLLFKEMDDIPRTPIRGAPMRGEQRGYGQRFNSYGDNGYPSRPGRSPQPGRGDHFDRPPRDQGRYERPPRDQGRYERRSYNDTDDREQRYDGDSQRGERPNKNRFTYQNLDM